MRYLSDIKQNDKVYGGKINSLIQLKQLGFNVPDGFIISEAEIRSLWEEQVDLGELNENSNLSGIEESLANIEIPLQLLEELRAYIEPGKTYAVRSSGLIEDHYLSSFAGQYESKLNNGNILEIVTAIKEVVVSMFSPKLLTYWREQQFSFEDFGLAILVQEQVSADLSGIAFSLNPLNGDENEWLIEYVLGMGNQLAEGIIQPYALKLNWAKAIESQVYSGKLTISQIKEIKVALAQMIRHFGRPLECEFSYVGQTLFLLQARPITNIPPLVKEGRWTNANFRDGGVAAQPCPNLMWSLYRDAWQKALSDYLVENKFFKRKEIPALATLKFAHPYWNIGVVKDAMVQIPGYIEKEFDNELGVQANYTDLGETSQLTAQTGWKLLRVAVANGLSTRKRLKQAERLKENLLEQYQQLLKEIEGMDQNTSTEHIATLWQTITQKAYLESEVTYFTQVFINTVQLALKKANLLKYISNSQLLTLLSYLGNVSHTRPYNRMQEIVTLINTDESLKATWLSSTVATLLQDIQVVPERPDVVAIKQFQQDYGYHSERELDISMPSFSESHEAVISIVKSMLISPEAPIEDETNKLEQTIGVLEQTLPPHVWRKVNKDITYLRKLLWWREEFKDISTRYYHLIRQISLRLGERYVETGILTQKEAIFNLKTEDIKEFMAGSLSQSDIQEIITLNQQYCSAFKSFTPPGDLWAEQKVALSNPTSRRELRGIGANYGRISGRVKVLTSFEALQEIQEGDILVTEFTDTGWSLAFPKIGALITETGGVLCHAAIVAREYGIPAIVNAKDATKILTTGMQVTLDGSSGIIMIDDK